MGLSGFLSLSLFNVVFLPLIPVPRRWRKHGKASLRERPADSASPLPAFIHVDYTCTSCCFNTICRLHYSYPSLNAIPNILKIISGFKKAQKIKALARQV